MKDINNETNEAPDISDESLSAFMDNELPPAHMEHIMEQLAHDDALADRFDTLMLAESQRKKALNAIDEEPMSVGLQQLIKQLETPTQSAKIIPFTQRLKMYTPRFTTAVAASFAALFGFVLSYGLQQPHVDSSGINTQIVQQLETTVSGKKYMFANQAVILRASFKNNMGKICRQYRTRETTNIAAEKVVHVTDNIACRNDMGHWQLNAKIPLPIMNESEYQTATNHSALDAILDQMGAGDFFTKAQEQLSVDNGWQ